MDECWRYQRLIMCVVLGLAVLGAALLWVLLPARWPLALGLLWGTAGGLVGYRMNVMAVYRFLQNPDQPPAATGFRWFLIAGLTVAAAVVANKLSGMNVASPYTVAAGIFLPNVVLMADGFLRRPAPVADEAAKKEDAGEA